MKFYALFNERTNIGQTKYGNPKREKKKRTDRGGKLKVSKSNIQIDQSGLKVFNSRVFGSGKARSKIRLSYSWAGRVSTFF